MTGKKAYIYIQEKKKKKRKKICFVVHTSYNESKTPRLLFGLKTQPLKISVNAGGEKEGIQI